MTEVKEKQTQGELIFALDIGTRSVIGVVGEVNGEMLKVLAIESTEHTKRAMLDGQVEDIAQVAKIAETVKKRLEDKLNVELTHVCVAAAGRSLKTKKETFEITFEEKQEISRSLVASWELNAVKLAQQELSEDDSARAFTCVGYSVTHYYLDDYQISTLVDHHGNKARVDIVATFLPDEVIASLYEVTSRIGLTVSNLTLEPIAAMNAIIPQELRLLNLALVDIGAGTSDIAVSNDGSVSAYTMVTLAGDEITEAIVRGLLVDFSTAERIKQEMSEGNEKITYQDVIGIDYTMSADEIFDVVKECADNLCGEIASAILDINDKKPAAVFLVGGGSRLANMAKIMAQKLDIPEQKVAVGGSNYMKKMLETEVDLTQAEYATPIGIAITAMNMKENSSITVKVNDVPINLFKNSVITVMDALLISGCKQSQIIGRSGQSVTFELNGSRVIARGGMPVPAQIQINGSAASLTTPINQGDDILVKSAQTGEDAHPMISEYVNNQQLIHIDFNGEELIAGSVITVNGRQIQNDDEINNLDKIEIAEIFSVGQLCLYMGLNTWDCAMYQNGAEVGGSALLNDYDVIKCVPKGGEDDYSSVLSDAPAEEAPTSAGAPRGEARPLSEAPIAVPVNGKVMAVTINNSTVTLMPKADGTPYLFFDMLNYVDIDPSKPQGDIVLLRNGHNAEYLEEIQDRDDIMIYWSKR